nr:hypothetical transcript [Hymenolepis microstoma]
MSELNHALSRSLQRVTLPRDAQWVEKCRAEYSVATVSWDRCSFSELICPDLFYHSDTTYSSEELLHFLNVKLNHPING